MNRLINTARLIGVVLLLLTGSQALASTAATMTIDTGASQAGTSQGGKVKGNKQPKGGAQSTATIELLSVTKPGSGDAASGSAVRKTTTGTALLVTKAYDVSSAVLEQAAATNQIFREVTIVFETPAGSGKGAPTGSSAKGSKGAVAGSGSKTAQVIVLKNAQISEIEQTRNIQQISIEYQSIEVTNAAGKPAASDDWETP